MFCVLCGLRVQRYNIFSILQNKTDFFFLKSNRRFHIIVIEASKHMESYTDCVSWEKQMNSTADLIGYVFNTYRVKPEYLWPDYPETFVFRHSDSRKWFVKFRFARNAVNSVAAKALLVVDEVNLALGAAGHRPGLAHEQEPLAGRPAGRKCSSADNQRVARRQLFLDRVD